MTRPHAAQTGPARIPLVDLRAQHADLRDELEAALAGVLASGRFVGGPVVAAFEAELARFCEVPHAVGVGNGTDAVYLALRALGVGPGDDVLTVPNTFIGTTEAVSRTGARPIFVDVDPRTGLMDLARVPAALSPRTRAVIPVHLYGQPVDVDALLRLLPPGVRVVEDAAQALGARLRGRPVGGLGDAGCFSFYPAKNLGACGDGGAVVCRDPALAERVRRLGNHGRVGPFDHAEEGVNSRLDALQAAVLRVKLPRLAGWSARRRVLAAAYDAALAGAPHVRPLRPPEVGEGVFHLYVARSPHRDALAAHLDAAGIDTGLRAPAALHLQPAYAHLGLEPGAFPEAEALSVEGLSLPLYPELGEAGVRRVAEAVARFRP